MSQGTVSDTLIGLEAYKGIFVFLPKTTFFQGIFCLTLTLTSSFVGYFFVPGPLGGIKSVSGDIFGHTDSI